MNQFDIAESNRQLVSLAIQCGNRDVLLELMVGGFDVEAETDQHQTPLDEAVQADDTIMALLLLLVGANPNPQQHRDCYGPASPLHTAVGNRNFDMVRLLVQSGADVNADGGPSWDHEHVLDGCFYAKSKATADRIESFLVAHGAKFSKTAAENRARMQQNQQ